MFSADGISVKERIYFLVVGVLTPLGEPFPVRDDEVKTFDDLRKKTESLPMQGMTFFVQRLGFGTARAGGPGS